MGRKSHIAFNEKKYLLRCQVCGLLFRSARPDAKTHSQSCRSRLSRQTRKATGDYMACEQAARGRNESAAISYALKHLGKK